MSATEGTWRPGAGDGCARAAGKAPVAGIWTIAILGFIAYLAFSDSNRARSGRFLVIDGPPALS
jgi:hypothetical protein